MQQRCERKMCKRGDGILPQVLVLTRKSQMNPFFWKHVTHNLNWGDNQSAHIKQMKSSLAHLEHCKIIMKAKIMTMSMLPHLPIFKNLSKLFYCDLYPWEEGDCVTGTSELEKSWKENFQRWIGKCLESWQSLAVVALCVGTRSCIVDQPNHRWLSNSGFAHCASTTSHNFKMETFLQVQNSQNQELVKNIPRQKCLTNRLRAVCLIWRYLEGGLKRLLIYHLISPNTITALTHEMVWPTIKYE